MKAAEDPSDGHSVPLRVHVLFHPSSTRARQLALKLFRLLNGPSTGWGPRIPVRFGASMDGLAARLPVLDAERSLVVVLVDARMVRRATAADRRTADAWARVVEELLTTYPPGAPSGCSVLPVAVEAAAFSLSPRLDDRSFVRLDANDERHLLFHVAIGCLRLMQGRPASEPRDVDSLPPVDVELFVSHAKRDLPREAWRGPVAALLNAFNTLPLKAWYDSSGIPVGARFGDEIESAVRRASAVIVVLTDGYSSREWCRREVLAAKAAGCPIVVVDAIESQVVRLFPYVGNAPTVRWRAALARATGSDNVPNASGTDESWEAEDASTVMLVTLFEALRYQHEVERLRMFAAASDRVLGTPPEAITVAAAPSETTRMIYPDPPLGREELEQVTTGRPDLELITPLERFAQWETPSGLDLVALSLSTGSDAERYGGSELHLATMAHDLALYLLLAGLRLLYGGVLGYGARRQNSRGPGDDVDYVERLMELVERYSPLARELGRPLEPIENWLAWPMYEELTDEQRNEYQGNRATLTEVPPPDDLDIGDSELRPGENGRYPDNTPLSRYVRARCLTNLRVESTSAASARVAMGGKLDGYTGLVPGVAEEVLLTLHVGKPVYLLGAFGGATRAVIDVMQGEVREELTSAWCEQHMAGWRELMDEYSRRGFAVLTPEQAADEFRSRGATGLAASLANGLSDHENEELKVTTDAQRAVELVLRGLHAVGRSGS
jgi:hypothetical protein